MTSIFLPYSENRVSRNSVHLDKNVARILLDYNHEGITLPGRAYENSLYRWINFMHPSNQDESPLGKRDRQLKTEMLFQTDVRFLMNRLEIEAEAKDFLGLKDKAILTGFTDNMFLWNPEDAKIHYERVIKDYPQVREKILRILKKP